MTMTENVIIVMMRLVPMVNAKRVLSNGCRTNQRQETHCQDD